MTTSVVVVRKHARRIRAALQPPQTIGAVRANAVRETLHLRTPAGQG